MIRGQKKPTTLPMRTFLIFVLLFGSVQKSFASRIQVSALSTPNSELQITGLMATADRWVWVHLAKLGESTSEQTGEPIAAQKSAPKGEQTDFFPVLQDHQFTLTIFLRFGPGKYEITTRESVSSSQYSSSYYPVDRFEVESLDAASSPDTLPSEWVESRDPEILALALQITQDAPDSFSKSKAIHDWVSSNIAYDTDAFFSGLFKNYSALDTLRQRKALCSGYSHLTAALHRALGIPARMIIGKASWNGAEGDHEWNEIQVGNSWIIEDTTWDAGTVSPQTRNFTFSPNERYFNPSVTDFAKDHVRIKVAEAE